MISGHWIPEVMLPSGIRVARHRRKSIAMDFLDDETLRAISAWASEQLDWEAMWEVSPSIGLENKVFTERSEAMVSFRRDFLHSRCDISASVILKNTNVKSSVSFRKLCFVL